MGEGGLYLILYFQVLRVFSEGDVYLMMYL